MIYRVVSGKVELIPEAIELVPAFARLTEAQIRFIVIAYDYTSGPYKMKPEEYRIDMAEKITGIKKKSIPENIKEEFISCIYDLRRDKKQLLQKKLILVHNQFEAETQTPKLKELSSLMDFLETRINAIDEDILNEDEMNVILKGKKELSFIERMIRNRKLYTENKKSKEDIKNSL